jgi:peptidoglycan hydrolase-like amidase
VSIRDAEGQIVGVADDAVFVAAAQGGALRLGRCAGACASAEGRAYPGGPLYVTLGTERGLAAVLSIDAETLLQGIVPAEIFASSPSAALEAQAIVARGAVLAMLGHRHHDAPYHVCDRQHCQVYRGREGRHPSTDQAVARTRGALAVRPRADPSAPLELVASVYSASCGGHGASNETVWDQPPSPSLRGRLDGPPGDPVLAPFRGGIDGARIQAWVEAYPPTYCARASFVRPEKFRWKVTHDARALRARWAERGLGAPIDVKVLGRGVGGRVRGLRLVGTLGTHDVLRELPVRRLFGLRSGAFAVARARDAEGRLSSLTFTGAGWGHGVGMCQMGAIGRAEAGHDAARILGHYYSGAVLERLYE